MTAAIIVICGPSGSGKTTVGRQVAQRLNYLHWEMSDQVMRAKLLFEHEHGEMTTYDFCEQVLWAGGNYAAAAADLVLALRQIRKSADSRPTGFVVTGARRTEEVHAITGVGLPTVLVYLKVPLAARCSRVDARVGRDLGAGVANSAAAFLAQTRREAGWGLLSEDPPAGFSVVGNIGHPEEAVAEVLLVASETVQTRSDDV